MQIENGGLRSNNGISIVNNGEITIGDNSSGIDDNTPIIYGKNVGIENNGIFNFYDGKIQGIVPIQGETTNTPEEYGPVQTGYENGITTIQLRILTQYEARIGWVYYETLQGAVDIAKEKETVSLIKDLQLKETLNVSEDKDIILDLYGYSLTVAPQINTVIQNYGTLEITDTSREQSGNITIVSTSHCYGIKNEGEGKLVIRNGKIDVESNDSKGYGIYNNSTERVIIYNGLIISNSINKGYTSSGNGSYGVYNATNGTVEIMGGIINSSNDRSNSSSRKYNK